MSLRIACTCDLGSVVKVLTNRRLGGSESARTEHPNREVVSSRPCVRARSVMHVESGIKWLSSRLLVSLWTREHLTFPFRIGQLELV